MINFNISSSSSIPNEQSSISTAILPDSQLVFRGSKPSILKVTAITSVFETDIPSKLQYDGDAGYHMLIEGTYTQGSQFRSTDIQFAKNLYANVQFVLSDSALMTQQIQKQKFQGLLGSLLGSIFGLLGAISGVMSFLEKYKIQISEKIRKQQEKKGTKWRTLKRIIALQAEDTPKSQDNPTTEHQDLEKGFKDKELRESNWPIKYDQDEKNLFQHQTSNTNQNGTKSKAENSEIETDLTISQAIIIQNFSKRELN